MVTFLRPKLFFPHDLLLHLSPYSLGKEFALLSYCYPSNATPIGQKRSYFAWNSI